MARAWKIQLAIGVLAAVALIPVARAQNYIGQALGYGQRYMGDIGRQQRIEQQRQQQAAQQAAAREHTPHVVSALYSGELRPTGDPRNLISGKTLYLERPIVADHQLVRMETEEIYFSANGKMYFPNTPTVSWSTNAEGICILANQQQGCMPTFVDNDRQIFFATKPNMLSHVVRIGSGDSANVVPRYAQYQKQVAVNNAAANNMLNEFARNFLAGPSASSGGGAFGRQQTIGELADSHRAYRPEQ